MLIENHYFKIMLVALMTAVLLLSGCSQTHKKTPTFTKSQQQQYGAQYWLREAKTLPSPQKEDALLNAYESLLNHDELIAASQLKLRLSSETLLIDQKQRLKLLNAELSLREDNPEAALSQISAINSATSLTIKEQTLYHRIKAEAFFKKQHYFESAKERVQLDHLLMSEAEINENQQLIWETVNQLSPTALEVLKVAPPPDILSGWMELAHIYQTAQSNFQQLVSLMSGWQIQYPLHPARDNLPSTLRSFLDSKPFTPRQIALLLPMTGPLKTTAKAIQDGFMTAYYDKLFETSAQIKFYDTNYYSAELAYSKAVNEGADFVIGPLSKKSIDSLTAQVELSVPTLTLNHTDHKIQDDNLFQFALLPEDEVRQVAELAFYKGFSNALVLAPNSEWGERLTKAFDQEWQSLGGNILDRKSYGSTSELAQVIETMLSLDASKARAKKIEKLVNLPVKTTPRRRHDVDFIFLVAFPEQGRQIKPLLKFHYAGNIPVLTTSHIFSGYATFHDEDLDGIQFCDMPWVLFPFDEVRQQMPANWEHDYDRFQRLFAFGYDAYKLVPHLNRLTSTRQSELGGLTGRLYSDEQGKIRRLLSWAEFKDGQPKFLSQHHLPSSNIY